MAMSQTTLALHALKTAKHAILTQLTQFHNVRHVIQGLYLIQKDKIVNPNATLLLSSTGMQESVVNAL